MYKLLFSILTTLFFALGTQAQTTDLTITIKNIGKAEGKIEFGLYNEAGAKYWLEKEGRYYNDIIDCTDSPSMTITIPNVEFGTYAFSLFHDENGNGEMDTRLRWIPTEPYGFSNDPKSKWSKPSFKTCSFKVDEVGESITVELYNW